MNKTEHIPNLFVPGFAKSGTTHLCHVLNASQDIFLPSEKEPHYFSHDLVPDSYRTTEATYLSFYANSSARYRLDGSVSYLYSKKAAESIAKVSKESYFLIMVRDPFERMVSHYRFNIRNGVEQRTFSQAIRNLERLKQQWLYDYIEMSDYQPQLERLLENFDGSTQVRLIDYNNYKKDPRSVIHKISEFLNIETPITEIIDKSINVSRQPKYPLLNAALRGDTPFKKAIKSVVPFGLRRSVKKYIHNWNVTDKEIPVNLDIHTSEIQNEMNKRNKDFKIHFKDLFI